MRRPRGRSSPEEMLTTGVDRWRTAEDWEVVCRARGGVNTVVFIDFFLKLRSAGSGLCEMYPGRITKGYFSQFV